MKSCRFRIPASTSNLGAGFDSVGLAVNRYLYISIEPASEVTVTVRGSGAGSIPTGPENLVLKVARSIATQRSRELPTFKIEIENEIPLSCGLGSSASAIIAGITCYECLAEDRLTDVEIFRYAFQFESHPDNLSPALYGGLISAASSTDGKVFSVKLSVAPGATPIVVIPEFTVSTEKARKLLPQSYSRADTVYNIQRAALLIGTLTSGQWSVLGEAMRDRIHQPYRASLIPGLAEILDLTVPGLFGIAVSGAGPAVFAFGDPHRVQDIGHQIVDVFKKHRVRSVFHELNIDSKGRSYVL